MIPISTALWDPKWYHKNSYNKYEKFIDKNGVINGLRIELLNPLNPDNNETQDCRLCTENDKIKYNGNCQFLNDYYNKISKINFDRFMKYLNDIAISVQNQLGFSHEPLIVLIVHETPKNPCSERIILQKYFSDNNNYLPELIYPIMNNY
jgi:hypothetical protein